MKEFLTSLPFPYLNLVYEEEKPLLILSKNTDITTVLSPYIIAAVKHRPAVALCVFNPFFIACLRGFSDLISWLVKVHLYSVTVSTSIVWDFEQVVNPTRLMKSSVPVL